MAGRFQVKQVIGDSLGAEIDGDLRSGIGPAELAELRQLYLEHSWLLFRNQHGLTREQQNLVAGAFGKVQVAGDHDAEMISNLAPSFVDPRGGSFATGALSYHSDGEFHPLPLEGLILFAKEVEDGRTSTRFANLNRAYRTLPAALKARCEGRDALHVLGFFASRTRASEVPISMPRWASPILDVERTSGKPILSISYQHCDSVVGLPEDESEELLEQLFAHAHAPENVITHWWRKGDFVVWDNRIFVHARDDVSDVGPRVFLRNSLGEGDLTTQRLAYEARLAAAG